MASPLPHTRLTGALPPARAVGFVAVDTLPLHTHHQEDVFIGELKFTDKEGTVVGCMRFAFSQIGAQEKQDL